jgi:hypothetical protein
MHRNSSEVSMNERPPHAHRHPRTPDGRSKILGHSEDSTVRPAAQLDCDMTDRCNAIDEIILHATMEEL